MTAPLKPSNQSTSKPRILIVEDEVLIAGDLAAMLHSLGYEVAGNVTSAEQALELVEKERPDLVLMDIVLQGQMDGIEAAEVIRTGWGVPIVFITAYGEADKLERAKLAYPFGYILKPFQERDIKITVEMALYVAQVEAERKRTEEERREYEEKYRLLVDNMMDAVFLTSPDGKVYSANPAACEMFGLSESEIIEGGRGAVIDGEDPRLPAALEERERTGRFRGELNCRRKDGTIFPGEVFSSVFRDKNGQLMTSTMVRDVSARKLAEEELRESEEKYRLLFTHAPAGIYEIDFVNARFSSVNDVMCEYTGYTREELLSMNAIEILSEESKLLFLSRLEKMLAGEPVADNPEYLIHDKSGAERWVALSTRFNYRQGKIQGATVVAHDITERKRQEAVRERLELQLRQAQKMEAIGTLAGGVAHEFNNLLQVIGGYTQLLLLNKNENNPDHFKLKAIEKATERATQLVKQLLLFGLKAEAERLSINLNQAVERAVKRLEQSLPQKIVIELRLDRRLRSVKADPVQLEHMLLYLGNNAADAMPEGGRLVIETQNITIEKDYVWTYLEATPGDYVLLMVSDTGRGMDEETIQHIFEPFYTTKEIGQGTGLGLASVHGIVKGHGGSIRCHSELGRGTTFQIYLPAS
ncbi:MAG: PAS domain S-box protein [Thermodesulfobacteriota bacterium]